MLIPETEILRTESTFPSTDTGILHYIPALHKR
jgi:hypothetical protein